MTSEFSLLEMVEVEEIKATGAKPKLPLKLEGIHSENLDVYRIPLDLLYYNNANGRIRSYHNQTDEVARSRDDKDIYNLQIEKLIEKSDDVKLRKTKKDIQSKGQLIFGYVLDDGRVIDGNRRFTALRQLQREDAQQYFFEAVILPITFENKANRELIKRLELALQMGIESKVDYDPVDAAVDVWQTVEIDKIMMIGDYAKNANIRQTEIQNRLNTVHLMREFLESINSDKDNFQFIKELKVYHPLFEIAKALHKLYPKAGPEMEDSKQNAFIQLHLLTMTGGDMVREIRIYIKDVMSSNNYKAFQENIEEPTNVIQDKLDEKKIETIAQYRKTLQEVSSDIRQIQKAKNDMIHSVNRSKDVDNFTESLRQIQENLEELNTNQGLSGNLRWNQFSEAEIRDIHDYMVRIENLSMELVDIYNDEI